MMPPMSDEGWHGLTMRYGLFFVAMAILNEVIWRTQSTDFWVTFKVFGIMALTIAFIMVQMPFINRHMLDPEPEGTAPDGARTREADADD